MYNAPSTPRWTAAIALLAAVLWVAQLTGGWEPPSRAGDFVHQDDSGLSHVIESNRASGSRFEVPERPCDPEALVSAVPALAPGRTHRVAVTLASDAVPCGRAYTRPLVRAPPHPFSFV
jgi:hypothetical protein